MTKTQEPPRFDLGPFIAGANRMKQAVPALNEEGPQRLLSRPNEPLIVLLRQSESGAERAFTLVNTQEARGARGHRRGTAGRGRAGASRRPAFAERDRPRRRGDTRSGAVFR